MDIAILSRIQFAFTISFHILFPAFSIGMATFLTIMEGCWLKTRNPVYFRICKFWLKVFALTFGMGVVSGIVMEFQFGTNWSGFTYAVGNVLGSLFTYEVLTAFFIEAGFLGVMLFGWGKVGPKLHYFATCLVFVGVTLSAFWILSANSWMQTPAGVTLEKGRFIASDWLHIIFNPSVIPRYIHMMLAAYITTGFVIASVSAYYILKQVHLDFAKKCFSFALWALTILVPLQIFVGDSVGLEVLRNQPIKTAAMEGIWNTQRGAPFLIFAYPDMTLQKNLFALKIPKGAAFINTHHWDGKLIGLKSVPKADQPFVPFVFYAFRIMVGLGLLMFLVVLISLWLRFRKQLYDKRWFLLGCVCTAPIGFVALWTGWITAETGRQPWVVYNYLRTDLSASHVYLSHVITSLALIVVVYGIIFGYFYFKFLSRILRAGPEVKLEPHDQPFTYLVGSRTEQKK